MKRILILTLTTALALTALKADTPVPGGYDYFSACQYCHGVFGGGDGHAAKLLPVKIPSWTTQKPDYMGSEAKLVARLTELKSQTLQGKSSFPHFTEKLTKNNLYSLALYIKKHKSLSENNVPMYSKTYVSACAYCHGFAGNGTGIIRGFKQSPKNFRSPAVQKLDANNIYKLLLKSQTKTVRLKGKIPHFPADISAADIKKIAAQLQKL